MTDTRLAAGASPPRPATPNGLVGALTETTHASQGSGPSHGALLPVALARRHPKRKGHGSRDKPHYTPLALVGYEAAILVLVEYAKAPPAVLQPGPVSPLRIERCVSVNKSANRGRALTRQRSQ